MKKYMMIAMIMVSTFSLAVAQFGNQGYASNDDRYYYDNDFVIVITDNNPEAIF